MKKRLLSAVSLLLALAITLSSCSLFKKSHKIIDGGDALYSILVSANISADVEDKLIAVSGAIKEITGVDLLEADVAEGAPRILIGDTGESASLAAAERIDATNFYIGFSGEDLVIQALNDAMLISALDYFLSTYVLAEDADIKEGRFALPQNLDYVSTALVCSGEEFSIICTTNASDRALAAIAGLRTAILDATGVDMRIKADLGKNDPSAKEIIVGSISRDESAALLGSLSYDNYFVGTKGNKVMILATNDVMLEYAIEEFINTFITSESAVVSKEQKTFSLPLSFTKEGNKNSYLLAKDGKSNAILIYPDEVTPETSNSITEFCEFYKLLTGCELPAYKVSERPTASSGSFEFLIGNTNRNASSLALSAITPGTWEAKVSRKCLTLAAEGDNCIRISMKQLAKALARQVQSTTSKSVYNSVGEVAGGANRLLFLHHDFTVSATAAPDISTTASGFEESSEGAYVLYQKNGTLTMYTAYLEKLEAAGYKIHEATQKTGNLHNATYYSSSEVLNVTFADGDGDKTIRVVVDPRNETTLQKEGDKSLTGRTDVEPLFIQIGGAEGLYLEHENGMTYAVRLCDGTFLMVDASVGTPHICETIFNTLQQYNVLEGKPIVACWIFTHGHSDHIGAFNKYCSTYTDDIEVRGVMYNFPSNAQTLACSNANPNPDDNTASAATLAAQEKFRTNAQKFGRNINIYKARTGMNYQFAGCNVEMLFTYEDYPKPTRKLTYYNDTSLVFRISLSDGKGEGTQTFMILGDASVDSCDIIVNNYGSYLRSTAVQISHHGYYGGTATIYNTIKAPISFWPQGNNYPNTSFSTVTRNMLKKSYSKVCYVGYHGTVGLTLAQIKAGAENGTVYYTGRTAAQAASGK